MSRYRYTRCRGPADSRRAYYDVLHDGLYICAYEMPCQDAIFHTRAKSAASTARLISDRAVSHFFRAGVFHWPRRAMLIEAGHARPKGVTRAECRRAGFADTACAFSMTSY